MPKKSPYLGPNSLLLPMVVVLLVLVPSKVHLAAMMSPFLATSNLSIGWNVCGRCGSPRATSTNCPSRTLYPVMTAPRAWAWVLKTRLVFSIKLS